MRINSKCLLAVLLVFWLFLMTEWIRLILYKDPLIPFL